MPIPIAVVDPGHQVPDYDRQLTEALADLGEAVLFVSGPRLYGRGRRAGRGSQQAAPSEVVSPLANAPRAGAAGGQVVHWQAFGRLLAKTAAAHPAVAEHPWLRRGLRAVGYGPEWLGVLRHFSGQAEPGTIFLQWSLAPLVDAAAARTLRQWGHRVVYTAHNILPHEPRPWQPFLLRQLYLAVDHVVVQSTSGQQALVALMAGRKDVWSAEWESSALERSGETRQGHSERSDRQGTSDGRGTIGFARRISVIAMPADTVAGAPGREDARRRLGVPSQARVALFFGHVRPYKGLDVLLQAWPSVSLHLGDAVLVVAGQVAGGAAGRRQLETAVAASGAPDKVLFHPDYVPADLKAAYFAAADVVVLPYRGPAESAVLAAARGHGRAVVASRVPGVEEAVVRGGGLLVAPEDPVALAGALVRLLGDQALRERLEAEAIDAARRWTWADAARQYASLIRREE